jgi:hypothetical protein
MPKHRTLVSAPLQNPGLGAQPPERTPSLPRYEPQHQYQRQPYTFASRSTTNLPASASMPSSLGQQHPNASLPPGLGHLRAESEAKAKEVLAGMLLRGSTPTPVPSLPSLRSFERQPEPDATHAVNAQPSQPSMTRGDYSPSKAKKEKKEKAKKEKEKAKDKKGKKGKLVVDEAPAPVEIPLQTLPEIEDTLKMGPRFSMGTLLQGVAELQSVSLHQSFDSTLFTKLKQFDLGL